jgi:hypothetical protein
MENSKIKNPAIKEIWDKSIWTGQPDASVAAMLALFLIPSMFLLFAFAFALYRIEGSGLEIEGVYFCVFLLFLAIIAVKTTKMSLLRNPYLMVALADGCIFFTGEGSAKSAVDRNASWFEESIDNIASFTLKTNGGKTTVILNFFEKFYAGTYGKTKALPLYRISNAEQLISILKGFGIKEEKI